MQVGESNLDTSPLSDITVLDLGQIYNGPYCSLLFAQLGANVIKIEGPNGETLRYRRSADTEGHEFLMLNSCKKSVSIDLKSERGKALFLEMVEHADVVLENFALGTMERLGLDYETLSRVNPMIVYASGKGYGSEGPYANMPAMDITVQAMSGVIAATGYPDGPPTKAGPAFMDFLGGIHLFGGILAALHHRDRIGRGEKVEVSMHDTVYPTLASALGGHYDGAGQNIPERTGNRHSGLSVAPYNVYKAADGYLALFCVTNRHWEALVNAIGQPELLDDERFENPYTRSKYMDEVDAIVEKFTVQHEKWDLVSMLRESRVPCAPVLTVAEVTNDEHLLGRNMIQDIEHPTRGVVRVPGCPIRLSEYEQGKMVPAPLLGQDNVDVLQQMLGFDLSDIDELRANGVIHESVRPPA